MDICGKEFVTLYDLFKELAQGYIVTLGCILLAFAHME